MLVHHLFNLLYDISVFCTPISTTFVYVHIHLCDTAMLVNSLHRNENRQIVRCTFPLHVHKILGLNECTNSWTPIWMPKVKLMFTSNIFWSTHVPTCKVARWWGNNLSVVSDATKVDVGSSTS